MSAASIRTAKAQGLALGFGLTFSACFMTFGAVGGFGLIAGSEGSSNEAQDDACGVEHEPADQQPSGQLGRLPSVNTGLVDGAKGQQKKAQGHCPAACCSTEQGPRPNRVGQASDGRADQRYDERLNCIHVAPCVSGEAYQPEGGPA